MKLRTVRSKKEFDTLYRKLQEDAQETTNPDWIEKITSSCEADYRRAYSHFSVLRRKQSEQQTADPSITAERQEIRTVLDGESSVVPHSTHTTSHSKHH